MNTNTTTRQYLSNVLNILPHKPYCTDDLASGLHVRPLNIAKTKAYIQLNPPLQQHYLIFDIDKAGSAYHWDDVNLPPPNIVIVNPETTHSQYIYKLAEPVATSEFSRPKPIKYLASIQCAYTERLGADWGYTGLICRNPFVYAGTTNIIHAKAYELSTLAEFANLNKLPPQRATEGLGRNCTLFDMVRVWAYKAVRFYRISERPRLFSAWLKEVEEYALKINAQFDTPLMYSEVRATAKSIAKYCYKQDPTAEALFIHKQTERGRKGGIAKGAGYEEKRSQARLMAIKGINKTTIAKELGVHRNTVNNWLK